MTDFYCRICEDYIDDKISKFHVEAHKRKFLSEQGRNPDQWYLADWEAVVRSFNPKNAKPLEIVQVCLHDY